jgi:hypothetical protein
LEEYEMLTNLAASRVWNGPHPPSLSSSSSSSEVAMMGKGWFEVSYDFN